MNRILRPIMKSVTKPGQMYPVRLLFGLGFDTATDVALLVLASTGAAGVAIRPRSSVMYSSSIGC
jgi:nickel/cobalt transporter (NiCoT) family protein